MVPVASQKESYANISSWPVHINRRTATYRLVSTYVYSSTINLYCRILEYLAFNLASRSTSVQQFHIVNPTATKTVLFWALAFLLVLKLHHCTRQKESPKVYREKVKHSSELHKREKTIQYKTSNQIRTTTTTTKRKTTMMTTMVMILLMMIYDSLLSRVWICMN